MNTTRSDSLTVTTPSDREITMTRGFNAPRRLVYDAYTKPELLKRWLLGPPGWSMEVCEIDLWVGGAWRFGWRGPEGAEMGMYGVYREIVPPERIVNTEIYEEDGTGGEAVVTLALTEQGVTTLLTVTMLFASREARDAALNSGMEQGAAASYDRLADLLLSLS